MCFGSHNNYPQPAPYPAPQINYPMTTGPKAAETNPPPAKQNTAALASMQPQRITTGTGLNIPVG